MLSIIICLLESPFKAVMIDVTDIEITFVLLLKNCSTSNLFFFLAVK
jgi:hypothetical protein